MFYKVKEVKTLDNYSLLITFENGKQKEYNIKQLPKRWKIFQKLIDEHGLFQEVKVDKGGYGISWDDDIDLSCNELWENGTEVK